ncbi:uroporphyrinogen-III synthase HemD, partial [Diplocarpon rosae]
MPDIHKYTAFSLYIRNTNNPLATASILPPCPPSLFPLRTVELFFSKFLVNVIVRLAHPLPKLLSAFRPDLVLRHPHLEILSTYPARIQGREQSQKLADLICVGSVGYVAAMEWRRVQDDLPSCSTSGGHSLGVTARAWPLKAPLNMTAMTVNKNRAEGSIPILLLKTKSTPNDGYEERFSGAKDGLEFDPTFVPVLEHRLLNEGLNIVKGLVRSRQIGKEKDKKYGGLIFTSQRAVEAFARLVEEGKGDTQWPYLQDVPIYTVGPATSRALQAIPQTPALNIFGADMGNGEALAYYMLDHYCEWYQERRIKPSLLFLVGEQRRDIIPKTLMDAGLADDHRIQVDELVIYGTGVMKSFEQEFSKVLLETKDIPMIWVVVFSPTGCDAMLRVLGLLEPETGKAKPFGPPGSRSTYIATIGPTTRDFLRSSFGFEPDVCAEKPSPEGVEAGIRSFLKTQC